MCGRKVGKGGKKKEGGKAEMPTCGVAGVDHHKMWCVSKKSKKNAGGT
jgi:hypothetical protein